MALEEQEGVVVMIGKVCHNGQCHRELAWWMSKLLRKHKMVWGSGSGRGNVVVAKELVRRVS